MAFSLVVLTSVEAAGGIVRPVSAISWGIAQSNGSLSENLRRSYATTLKSESEKYDIDPFTIVAIIWHESHWRAGAVGDNGEAIGLGQIHYRHLCKGDAESCEKTRLGLFDGNRNIRVVARMIDTMRRYCRRVTGKPAWLARWLHAYGYNQRKNLKCNMRKVKGRWLDNPVPTELGRLIQYRKDLIRKLRNRSHKGRRR